MSTKNPTFFFIRHPDYSSYTLVSVAIECDALPDGFKRLIPHEVADIEDVIIERDDKRLQMIIEEDPELFEDLAYGHTQTIDNVAYREVYRYHNI